MGWTVVEPLSPGVFQIDPSVYGAEQLRVFNVGTATVGRNVQKSVMKEIWQKMAQAIMERASRLISSRVGRKVTVEVSEEVGESFVQKATKQLDDEVLPSGMTGKQLKEANPGSYTSTLNKRVQKLTDDAAEGMIDPDDLGKAIKLDDVAKANKLADDAAQKGGKEIGEEVIEEGEKKLPKNLLKRLRRKLKMFWTKQEPEITKDYLKHKKGYTEWLNRTGLSVIALWGAYSLLLPYSHRSR